MRKSGLKQRSRRKGIMPPPANGQNNEGPASATSPESLSSYGNDIGERRKPTNEEAALSARNNRLAKELNELRVRLRDETKTVTRLTMENMNLATRCREAISHVAILKKELDMLQRRPSESFQQEQDGLRSPSSNFPGRETGKILSTSPLHHSAQLRRDLPRNEKYDMPSPRDTYNGQVQTENDIFNAFDDEHVENETRPDPQNHSSSATNIIISDQEGPADELMYDNSKAENGMPISSDHFLPPASKSASTDREKLFSPVALPSNYQKKESVNERGAFDRFDAPPTTTMSNLQNTTSPPSPPTRRVSQIKTQSNKNSSLDAFEASFENAFPSSFSSPFEEPTPLSIAFDKPEFPDPFFLGSNDNSDGEGFGELSRSSFEPSQASTAFEEVVQSNTSNKPKSYPANEHDGNNISNNFNGFQSEASLDLFPPSNDAFDFADEPKSTQFNSTKASNSTFQTPNLSKSQNEDPSSIREPSSPRVVKKVGGNSARARYLAATGNLASSIDTNMNINKAQDVDHQVRRSNQRKKKGNDVVMVNSPQENIRTQQLNKNQSAFSLPTLSNNQKGSRRNVRHPIPYADPSLNSKVRRGHDFFPKTDIRTDVNKKDRRENEAYDDILKDLASSSAIHNVS